MTKATVFHYYNCNPHHVRTDDCVIRAIAAATGDSWEETLRNLTDYMIKDGHMIGTLELYGKYLKDIGFIKHKQPLTKTGKKMKFSEFCKKFDGEAVCNCGKGHVTYVSENGIWDIWNCEDEIVGNYWTCK